MKDKAIEAFTILNNFVGDLIAGTRTLEFYQSPKIAAVANSTTQLFVRRMCLSYLIITLSKWSEFYERYKAIIPSDIKEKAKNLQKEIERRKVRNFRNTVVGHVWDKEISKVLTAREIDSRLEKIFISSEADFLSWINSPVNQSGTVIEICEALRMRIQEEYKLTDEEIFT